MKKIIATMEKEIKRIKKSFDKGQLITDEETLTLVLCTEFLEKYKNIKNIK